MSDDIVDRLREQASRPLERIRPKVVELLNAAADEIESLELENWQLRQNIIGGIRIVWADQDMSRWAEESDKHLRETSYSWEKFTKLAKATE